MKDQTGSKNTNSVAEAISKMTEEEHFSDDFKDLIASMLAYNPCLRLEMADIIGHPWMQGHIATEDEIRKEFKGRVKKLKIKPNV